MIKDEGLKEKVLKAIKHPNRRIMAERILNGEDREELEKEFGSIKMQEMDDFINEIRTGRKRKCKLCF